MIYTLRDKKESGDLDAALDEIENVVDYDPATNEVTLRFDDDNDD
jgi:hypothetical protein